MIRTFAAALSLVACLAVPCAPASADDKTLATFNKFTLKRNYGKAAAVLTAAAKSGDSEAQYRLAGLYRIGLGVAQDDGQMQHWLAASAAQGNKKAIALRDRLALVLVPRTTTITQAADQKAAQETSAPVTNSAKSAAGIPWLMAMAARSQLAAAQALLKGGADINAGLDSGQTPLMVAASQGTPAMVSALLAAGADPNARDKTGRTALMLAAQAGKPDVLSALLAGHAAPDLRDDRGDAALNYAARACSSASIAQLTDAQNGLRAGTVSNPPLVDAARSCAEPQLVAILGGDVDDLDADGRTALWQATLRGKPDIVKALLAVHANPNIPDRDGLTPLHIAAHQKRADLLRLLIASGGDSAAVTLAGDMPLATAAASGCDDCIEELRIGGNGYDIQNANGDTALMIAVKTGNASVVKRLLAAGANTRQRNARRQTAKSIAKAMAESEIVKLLSN